MITNVTENIRVGLPLGIAGCRFQPHNQALLFPKPQLCSSARWLHSQALGLGTESPPM